MPGADREDEGADFCDGCYDGERKRRTADPEIKIIDDLLCLQTAAS